MKKMTLTLIAFLTTFAVAKAQARIDKEDRVLLVVSELQEHGSQNLRGLYRVIENLTSTSTSTVLGDDYRQIYVLKGAHATVVKFRNTLHALSKDSRNKAIDVIFSLHGSPDEVYFREGGISMSSLLTQVTATTPGMTVAQISTMKRKLRMIYNLSCFGRSHNNEFIAMGFDVSVGSNGVNANSEVEYVSALSQWSFNWKFIDVFAATNNQVALAAADTPIRLAGIAADSKKHFMGQTQITISTDPR